MHGHHFLDFQKAFESVTDGRLLSKLTAYCLIGTTADWVRNIVTNRYQRVIVENGKSEWVNVISILGPTLFVIFINELSDVITSTFQIFADGTTIYRTVNDIRDEILLQEDLNKLHQWSVKWQLKFKVKKCKVIHLGSQIEYLMDGNQ